MAIDRIQYIGMEISGDVMVLAAGRLKYRLLDESFKDVLIDGTNVHEILWTHIEFTITFGYLGQQVIDADAPQGLIVDLGYAGYLIWDAEITFENMLRELRRGAVNFFPRLYDQENSVDVTKYSVVPTKDTYELMDARSNGRFNMYTPLTFITETPLDSVPTWINR